MHIKISYFQQCTLDEMRNGVLICSILITGSHEIPVRMIRQSSTAARSFSTEVKDVLKKQILLKREDMGCQLPILVASVPGTTRFDANYVSLFDLIVKYKIG